MKASVHPNTFVCLVALLALPLIALFSGCSTVTQQPVASAAASYDGNQQNSGILEEQPDGSYVVTAHFRDRYNALISIYSAAKTADGSPIFVPSLIHNTGLRPQPDGSWLMDKQAMADMVVLSDLKRRGFKP